MKRDSKTQREKVFLSLPREEREAIISHGTAFRRRQRPSAFPCVTIRENMERPITVELGTNVLAGTSKAGILRAYREALEKAKHAAVPPLWDGKAAERIWGVLQSTSLSGIEQIEDDF